MKKILLFSILLVLFTSCVKDEFNEPILAADSKDLVKSSSIVINVPEDYTTIQEAVNNAQDGTVIYASGTFYEYIRIENLDGIRLICKEAVLKLPDLGYYSRMVKIINCDNFEVSGFTFDCDYGQLSYIDPSLNNILSGIVTLNSSGKICNNHFKNFLR